MHGDQSTLLTPHAIMLLMLASVLFATAASAVSAEGPCDILGAAGNPCVAAHSTVRALYSKYDGALYNVSRTMPGSAVLESTDIGLLSAGGFANASATEEFCAGTETCVISNVYDQSPQHNHLGARHGLVNATKHKIVAGGEQVFGMWFDPGFGMHVDNTTGIAMDNQPESIFAVMSGTHYNGACCFDCKLRPRALLHGAAAVLLPLTPHTCALLLCKQMATRSLTTKTMGPARWRPSISGTPTGVAAITGRVLCHAQAATPATPALAAQARGSAPTSNLACTRDHRPVR
jgi:hypothetical protein